MTDMFDRHPRLKIEKPRTMDENFCAYLAVAHVPCRSPGGSTISRYYAGSAIRASKPGGGLSGKARRFEEHWYVLKRGHEEIIGLRLSDKKQGALFVHEKMSVSGAVRIFTTMSSYPQVLPDRVLQSKAQCLALLSEKRFGSLARIVFACTRQIVHISPLLYGCHSAK
jgi:hypothetical protein